MLRDLEECDDPAGAIKRAGGDLLALDVEGMLKALLLWSDSEHAGRCHCRCEEAGPGRNASVKGVFRTPSCLSVFVYTRGWLYGTPTSMKYAKTSCLVL